MAVHLLMHNYTSELLRSLYQLQKCCHLCDLDLKAKDGMVHIHAAVMAAACPQFLARVNKPYRGLRKTPRPPNHVDLMNFTVDAVEVFARFLYTGEIDIAVGNVEKETECLLQVKDIFKDMGLNKAEQLVGDRLSPQCPVDILREQHGVNVDLGTLPLLENIESSNKLLQNDTIDHLQQDSRTDGTCGNSIVFKNLENNSYEKTVLDEVKCEQSDTANWETTVEESHLQSVIFSSNHFSANAAHGSENSLSHDNISNQLGIGCVEFDSGMKKIVTNSQGSCEEIQHEPCYYKSIDSVVMKSNVDKTIQPTESPSEDKNADQVDGTVKKDYSTCADSQVVTKKSKISKGNSSEKLQNGKSPLRKARKLTPQNKIGNIKICENCSKEFASKRALSKHIINCAAIKPHLLLAKCKKCGKELRDNEALKLHKPDCAGRPKQCRKCYKTFEDQKSMKDHKKDHERDYGKWYRENKRPITPKMFRCDQCDKTFRTRMNRLVHMNCKHDIPFEASDVPVFSCDFEGCKYKNTSQALLDFHRQRHDGTRPYQCTECGEGFPLGKELKMHKRKVHHQGAAEEELSTCHVCKKSMKSTSLKGHISRLHDPTNKLLCEFCDFQVVKADKSTLFLHLHTQHQQPMPAKYTVYTCSECPYMTVNKTNLNAHIRRHTGDFPYMCGFCGKRFPASSDCTSHEKFHIKDKKFKCPYEECTYAAVNKTSLKTHVKCMHTHKDSKEWICSICDYRTNLKGNLHLHLRNVHKLEIKTSRGPTKINVAPGSRRSSNTPGVITLLGGQVVATKGNPPQKLIVNILKTEGQLTGPMKLPTRVLPQTAVHLGTGTHSTGLDLVQGQGAAVSLMSDIGLGGHVLNIGEPQPGQSHDVLAGDKEAPAGDLGIPDVSASAAHDIGLTPAAPTISPGPESDYSSILLNPAETQPDSTVQNILDGQPEDNLESESQGQIYHQMHAASQSYNYQLPYDIPDVGQLGLSGLPSYFSNT